MLRDSGGGMATNISISDSSSSITTICSNSSMPVNVNQSLPSDWVYLSEGGATIVFSYTGPASSHFTGRILRLRKIPLKDASRTIAVDKEEPDDPAVAFQYNVVASLIPPEYLPELEVVLADAHWLTTLEELRNGDRPAERRMKDCIDRTRRKGILATDLVSGTDTLAVEIKPKWGFLPNPTHLSQETAAIKTSTCRFCMHTSFREDHDTPSQYCPLDLYSGDDIRMKKAIDDLWKGWVQSDGIHNNMRIFVSGRMIKPSDSCAVLEEFISRNTKLQHAFSDALLPFLRSSVLRTISDLQRSLDALDIEGLAKLYAVAHPDARSLSSAGWTPQLKEWQDFVASYRSTYCTWDHSAPSPDHVNTYLMAYLLSATFKDCSVIFRIQRSTALGESSADDPHAISIIDLDVKGIDRLGNWMDLDRRIVEHYQNVTPRKLCFE